MCARWQPLATLDDELQRVQLDLARKQSSSKVVTEPLRRNYSSINGDSKSCWNCVVRDRRIKRNWNVHEPICSGGRQILADEEEQALLRLAGGTREDSA